MLRRCFLEVITMIRDIPKPEISPDFTVDDIHIIREWHYEMLKDATTEEIIKFYNQGASKMIERIERVRKERIRKEKAPAP